MGIATGFPAAVTKRPEDSSLNITILRLDVSFSSRSKLAPVPTLRSRKPYIGLLTVVARRQNSVGSGKAGVLDEGFVEEMELDETAVEADTNEEELVELVLGVRVVLLKEVSTMDEGVTGELGEGVELGVTVSVKGNVLVGEDAMGVETLAGEETGEAAAEEDTTMMLDCTDGVTTYTAVSCQ